MSFLPNSLVRVGVLRGGPSRDYDTSLQTGSKVLSILHSHPEKYRPVDIFISKSGHWHVSGVHQEPHQALKQVDVVFNALCGEYGEDGRVQSLLTSLKVPFTGSSPVSSVIALNKDMAKEAYKNHGLLTPRYEIVTGDDEVQKLIYIFRNYLHPVVVKPNSSDGRKAIRLAYTFEDLVRAVDEALEYSPKVLVEEFVRGREATCSIVEKARDQKLYALLPIEISAPIRNNIPDYENKFKNNREILPSTTFSTNEHKMMEHIARRAHEALSLGHYSSSDMIMTPRGKIYLIETNAQPLFSEGSIMDESLSSVGWSAEDFVDHLIQLAIGGK